MSREVRMVPPDWKHPKGEKGYIGLFSVTSKEGVLQDIQEWLKNQQLWSEGKHPDQQDNDTKGIARYTDWHGAIPSPDDYMPYWPPEVATHFCMYETTSEGTPVSPAFATQEELARWLTDNNISTFGRMTTTYDKWLAMIKLGYSIASMARVDGEMHSGVDAVSLKVKT